MERHFYRCLACLDVLAVEGGRVMSVWDASKGHQVGPHCDCGGTLNWMGKVRTNYIVRPEERCPCDSRCADATGPNCDCVCGGKNHGTHRTVTVDIVAGSVPTVRARDDLDTRKVRVAEFQSAKDAAIARIDVATGGAITANGEGRRVEYSMWQKKEDLVAQYRKARKYLIHSRRIEALNKIAA